MFDPTDHRGVPVSKGIPHLVQWAAAVGMLMIFGMGYLTVKDADNGHQWPAAKTLRMDLGSWK